MTGVFLTVTGLSLAAVVLCLLELRRTSGIYQTIYDLLVAERDQAREESKTLRAALFPQLARTAAPPSKGEGRAAAPRSKTPLTSPRIPWRIRFKQLVRENNTTQIGRDRVAAAIQENKNA